MLTQELRLMLLGSIETAINQVFALDPTSRERLAADTGKVIALQITGLNLNLFLLPGPDGINVMEHYRGEADVSISGPPASLLNLALSDDTQTILHRGDVVIRGDMELGFRINRLLRQLDLDWEDALSRYTGDVVAYKLGSLWRDLTGWAKDATEQLAENGAEYLHYEGMEIPLTSEVAAFNRDIDQLRNDTDRLEARLARLEQQQTDSTSQQ